MQGAWTSPFDCEARSSLAQACQHHTKYWGSFWKQYHQYHFHLIFLWESGLKNWFSYYKRSDALKSEELCTCTDHSALRPANNTSVPEREDKNINFSSWRSPDSKRGKNMFFLASTGPPHMITQNMRQNLYPNLKLTFFFSAAVFRWQGKLL